MLCRVRAKEEEEEEEEDMDQMVGAAHTNGLADYPVVQDPEAIVKLAPDHATHEMTDCNMGGIVW